MLLLLRLGLLLDACFWSLAVGCWLLAAAVAAQVDAVAAAPAEPEAASSSSRPLLGLQGQSAKMRRVERSSIRALAHRAGQQPPTTKATMDPPPRICNRTAVAWGTPVKKADCQCADFSRWIGKHKADNSLVQPVDSASDCLGKEWHLDDKITYWRPGGKNMKERFGYNGQPSEIWRCDFQQECGATWWPSIDRLLPYLQRHIGSTHCWIYGLSLTKPIVCPKQPPLFDRRAELCRIRMTSFLRLKATSQWWRFVPLPQRRVICVSSRR